MINNIDARKGLHLESVTYHRHKDGLHFAMLIQNIGSDFVC